jgi:hypothetical protein
VCDFYTIWYGASDSQCAICWGCPISYILIDVQQLQKLCLGFHKLKITYVCQFPTAYYCPLPTVYSRLPIAHCLLPVPFYCLLPFANCLLHVSYSMLPVCMHTIKQACSLDLLVNRPESPSSLLSRLCVLQQAINNIAYYCILPIIAYCLVLPIAHCLIIAYCPMPYFGCIQQPGCIQWPGCIQVLNAFSGRMHLGPSPGLAPKIVVPGLGPGPSRRQ